MQEQEGFISLPGGRLHYLKWGRGGRLLLAFHGYGNNAAIFQAFRRYLERDFTILSFDLPHHGKSSWDEKRLLHKQDLTALLSEVMKLHSCNKVSLMGYSMGGRLCLTMAGLMPDRIDNMLLIASDGLVFNPLYYFVTRTFVGRQIFRRFLTRPERYIKLAQWLRDKKWIDPVRYRFALYYIESEADRALLLKVWPSMSLIVPDMRRLRMAIRKHRMSVFIFMGNNDRIIPVPQARRFKKGLDTVQLVILDKGHRVFDSETLPQMADCLIKGTC